MQRRSFLAAWLAFSSLRECVFAAAGSGATVGICTFSCHLHWQAVRSKKAQTSFTDTATFYDYARQLGADGVQTSFRELDIAGRRALRLKCEKEGAYLEGDVRLPKSPADLDAFEDEVRLTREIGATVARAIFTGGRRYETFRTLEEFQIFHRQSMERLKLAAPIAAKHQLKLAVENHKDLTLDEQLAMLEKIGSEWIGALVDTGNNIALLDDPYRVIEGLAPWAMSVHLKDMAIQPDPSGFRLSEVPCGTGLLDMPRVIRTLRAANPHIVFNLEMATRDPLKVPCLTDAYWATFPERRASHLEAAMALVSRFPLKQAAPSISGKSLDEQLRDEEENNRLSLAWMRQHLS